MRKLVARGKTLVVVYEAGPCGFSIHRWLKARGHECWAVSPSLMPKKPGERIKTDRRDAVKRARLARAGELTAIYVPEAADEAAWAHQHPARITPIIARRQGGVTKSVLDIAWKAQLRLCARFRKLAIRGVNRNKLVVAVARELAGFVWAIDQQVRPT